MFEVTYRCNFHCKHCYVPDSYRNYGELDTKEIFAILDRLKEIGCFYLGFTGGEPFMRADFPEILSYAKQCGFTIIIYTNGSLIDQEKARQLADLNPNKVDITIPAMSTKAFEAVSGVPGSRDKVFQAIELLHKNDVALGFKSCLLKENESEISHIQDFARGLSCLHRLDDQLSPRLDGCQEPYEYRGRLPSQEAEGPDCQAADTAGAAGLFSCGVGATQAAITPLGELKMCIMIDRYKYKVTPPAGSLQQAWERLKADVSSIEPDQSYQCPDCRLNPYCKWCPAKSWLYNRTFTSCVPHLRDWAKKKDLAYTAIP